MRYILLACLILFGLICTARAAEEDEIPWADRLVLRRLIDAGVIPESYGSLATEHMGNRRNIATAVAEAIENPNWQGNPEISDAINALFLDFSDYLEIEALHVRSYPTNKIILSSQLKTAAPSAYDYVPVGYWAYHALDHLAENGTLEGYPDGFFNGNRVLTRYEFAQAIARLLDKVDATNPTTETRIIVEALQDGFADQLADYFSSMNQGGYTAVPVLP